MGQTRQKSGQRFSSGVTIFAGLLLSVLPTAVFSQQPNLSDAEVATLNAEASYPALLFPNMPRVRVNGQLSYLVGLNESQVLFLTQSKRPRTLTNSEVTSVAAADGTFDYRPSAESLLEFVTRVSQAIPNFTQAYGVIYNNSSYMPASDIGSSAVTSTVDYGRTAAPMPVYPNGDPSQQTVLLNPPKVVAKPRPKPTPPPKVEAPPESTGFPTWAKYGVAALGIAAIFVVVKK